ncbi:hypothetical protein Tco_0948084, partial [Tanacetum coccineum]
MPRWQIQCLLLDKNDASKDKDKVKAVLRLIGKIIAFHKQFWEEFKAEMTPKDALTIIENKSKVCTSRNRPVVAKVSTNTSTSGLSPDVATLTDAVTQPLLQLPLKRLKRVVLLVMDHTLNTSVLPRMVTLQDIKIIFKH